MLQAMLLAAIVAAPLGSAALFLPARRHAHDTGAGPGWSGLHVDQSWGYGIMPLTFEALKGQRYRWCFGGIQLLRMHWRSMMPGRRNRENHLTVGQRWAYLAGGVQWYVDLLGLLFKGLPAA